MGRLAIERLNYDSYVLFHFHEDVFWNFECDVSLRALVPFRPDMCRWGVRHDFHELATNEWVVEWIML